MYDLMNVIQIQQAFQHGGGDHSHYIDLDSAKLFVDTVEGGWWWR
jgi:hypothetical protein